MLTANTGSGSCAMLDLDMTFSEAPEGKEKTMSKLTLETEGERYVAVTRRFAAPPEAVYRAHTDAKLVQKWMLGPEGWTMPVCICEAKPKGKIRYEWSNGKGAGFYLTGEFIELEPSYVRLERMI
jgi:activator of Hsp90 ATPase-like protein